VRKNEDYPGGKQGHAATRPYEKSLTLALSRRERGDSWGR